MKIDYEKLQRRYKRQILRSGIVDPHALISAIHELHPNPPADADGFGDDGYRLKDVSGGSWRGYKYELLKDGKLLLISKEKWRGNEGGKIYIGFDVEEIERL